MLRIRCFVITSEAYFIFVYKTGTKRQVRDSKGSGILRLEKNKYLKIITSMFFLYKTKNIKNDHSAMSAIINFVVTAIEIHHL